MKIRLIELFAGIGSQAKALTRLGIPFEHYRVCEFDKFAVTSYNAIHGTDFKPSDIRDWNGSDLGITDTDEYLYILTYSFPCTDISVSGRMDGMAEGSGTRSSMLWEVLRLLRETAELPQILLMENVTQVHSKKNSYHWKRLLFQLHEFGYTNFHKDLNAKHFGIPQNRNRTFMISTLGSYKYKFPHKIPLTKCLDDILETAVDDCYFLADDAVDKMQNYKQPEISRTVRVGGSASTDIKHSWDIVVVGKVNSDGYEKCKDQNRRVHSPQGISPTVTTAGGGKHEGLVITEKRIRRYTEREIFRLMNFSDEDFDKVQAAGISNTQIKKQAGNSICVGVLEAVFRELLIGENRVDFDSFSEQYDENGDIFGVDSYSYTQKDLKILQSLPLSIKIQKTQAKIMEWYLRHDGNVAVNFSGGADSTVLLYIARYMYPDIRAIFCDTGIEYPEVKAFVLAQDNIETIRPQLCEVCTSCEIGCFGRITKTHGFCFPTKDVAQTVRYANKGSQ